MISRMIMIIIARQYKRIYAQGNALIRKFYMCSDHVKCTLFRSFCTSLYTCQLWCNSKSESIRKLYVTYNNVFRLLCNEPRYCSASYMFVTRGLPTCKMLIRKKVYSFMMCIAKSSNTILQSILNSDDIRHKCINTGEVYYTYIIFDSNIHYYFGKCAITG